MYNQIKLAYLRVQATKWFYTCLPFLYELFDFGYLSQIIAAKMQHYEEIISEITVSKKKEAD